MDTTTDTIAIREAAALYFRDFAFSSSNQLSTTSGCRDYYQQLTESFPCADHRDPLSGRNNSSQLSRIAKRGRDSLRCINNSFPPGITS